jgi:NAD(P)-dependent dehydrogenase (short-subunit alcohol dehydrogenase family)
MNNTLQDFTGRTALVTGAGADVGRAVALALSRAGARVVVHALDGEGDAEAVAAEARALGGEAAIAAGDVADARSAEAIVTQARDAFGPIDMLVHCVGIRPHSSVAESSVEEWHLAMDTNCSSFFYLARQLLPDMTARKFGRMITVTVALDDRTHLQHAAVGAARAALRELVKSVAVETGPSGVTANLVSIAINETSKPALLEPATLQRLVPLHRPGKLDEIASACLYLASDQAAFITGQTLHVDGGFTL